MDLHSRGFNCLRLVLLLLVAALAVLAQVRQIPGLAVLLVPASVPYTEKEQVKARSSALGAILTNSYVLRRKMQHVC